MKKCNNHEMLLFAVIISYCLLLIFCCLYICFICIVKLNKPKLSRLSSWQKQLFLIKRFCMSLILVKSYLMWELYFTNSIWEFYFIYLSICLSIYLSIYLSLMKHFIFLKSFWVWAMQKKKKKNKEEVVKKEI